MSTQMLIYETAVPVSKQKHAKFSVEVGTDYGFSRNINAVPLLAIEFLAAAAEYPVVFTESGGQYMPAAILGLRGQENLFLSPTNEWQAKYIPAFVRRYPFVFAQSPDAKTFTLCVDETFSGLNQEDRGVRLFGEDGNPSSYVNDMLKFLQEYQNRYHQTQAFCRNLDELELLEPMNLQMSSPTGEKSALTGFFCVSRAKVKALTGKTLARLVESDQLELLYTHLYSLRNFKEVNQRQSAKAPAANGDASKAKVKTAKK